MYKTSLSSDLKVARSQPISHLLSPFLFIRQYPQEKVSDSMEDTPQTPQKIRNARACEACRASKSRCYFRDAEQNICQRCEQSGYSCVVRTKARPMRARVVYVYPSLLLFLRNTSNIPPDDHPILPTRQYLQNLMIEISLYT